MYLYIYIYVIMYVQPHFLLFIYCFLPGYIIVSIQNVIISPSFSSFRLLTKHRLFDVLQQCIEPMVVRSSRVSGDGCETEREQKCVMRYSMETYRTGYDFGDVS